MNSSCDIRVLTVADTDALAAFYHCLPPATVHYYDQHMRPRHQARLRKLHSAEIRVAGFLRLKLEPVRKAILNREWTRIDANKA